MIRRVSCLGIDMARGCRDIAGVFGYENTLTDWAAVKYRVESGLSVMFVCQYVNGDVKGFLVGTDRGNNTEVEALFVNNDLHRRGIGTALLMAYENYCVEMGVKKIKLVPRETKQARAFYAKYGYVWSGWGRMLQKTL